MGGAAEKTRGEGGMWGVWEGAVYFFDSRVAVGGGAVMKLYVYVWGVEGRGVGGGQANRHQSLYSNKLEHEAIACTSYASTS